MRDPRLNPKVGDEIKHESGMYLRVSFVDDSCIKWERKRKDKWMFDNSWTLQGWVDVVARRAQVVKVAV